MKEIESYGIEIDFYKTMILIKDEILTAQNMRIGKVKKERIAKIKNSIRYIKRMLLKYTKNDDTFNLEFVSQYLEWAHREFGYIHKYKNHSFDLCELSRSPSDNNILLETTVFMDKDANKQGKEVIKIETATHELIRDKGEHKLIHNVYTLPVMTVKRGHGYICEDLLNYTGGSTIKPLDWEMVKKLKKEMRRVVLDDLKIYSKLLKSI